MSDRSPPSRPSRSLVADILPDNLAVFPLAGVVLLPDGRLPLNIFEKRYLAMVDSALAGSRMIGMIQPVHPLIGNEVIESPVIATSTASHRHNRVRPQGGLDEAPLLYRTGCAGRIVSFEETDDGRYQIELRGVCRFDIAEEQAIDSGGFRVIRPIWDRFIDDLTEHGPRKTPDRQKLIASLRLYFTLHGLSADWDVIDSTPDDKLLATLAMVCPFAPGEKQALLEAGSLLDLAHVMQTLIDMALLTGHGRSDHNFRH